MEISEPVLLKIMMSENELCRGVEEPEQRGWKCRIGKTGDPGDLEVPTAERLHSNMKKAGVSLPADPAKIGEKWDLESCTHSRFPFQSHHLIPKMHLPNHDVCMWLAKNAATEEWKLIESTDYDTDDARNGMPLPFASNTYQWKNASPEKKTEICNILMYKTGLQLHQGSHTYEDYKDYGEETALHENEKTGYLGAVDQLLEVIHGETLNHVMICPECKKSAQSPIIVRPLERVSNAVHKASGLMRGSINKRRVFVSERAAKYVQPKI